MIERIKRAVANDEDYRSVAAELGRQSTSVRSRMISMKFIPGTLHKGSFTFEEDVHILDRVITCLKFQKLSSTGFLSMSVFLQLAQELRRNIDSLRMRWEGYLQP